MEQNKRQMWLKRVGIGGFLFFFIKGLVWLGVFAFAFFSQCS